MISEHELLENGNKQQRCQVVRWVRTFPFSFLSKREYCIGRRMWRSQDGCLYGITKVTPPLPVRSTLSPDQSACHFLSILHTSHSTVGYPLMCPGLLSCYMGCCKGLAGPDA